MGARKTHLACDIFSDKRQAFSAEEVEIPLLSEDSKRVAELLLPNLSHPRTGGLGHKLLAEVCRDTQEKSTSRMSVRSMMGGPH